MGSSLLSISTDIFLQEIDRLTVNKINHMPERIWFRYMNYALCISNKKTWKQFQRTKQTVGKCQIYRHKRRLQMATQCR